MTIILIQINCPNRDTALAISTALIACRLAASTNINDQVTSAYHWQGEVKEAPEVALWVKTRAAHFDAIVQETQKLHPYKTPCIIGMPISYCSDAYRAWIMEETNVRRRRGTEGSRR